MKLALKRIKIQSSFKSFGVTDGMSSGTEMGVECEIPLGIEGSELAQEVDKVTLWLELRVLEAEASKGMLPQEMVGHYRGLLVKKGKELRDYDGQQ